MGRGQELTHPVVESHWFERVADHLGSAYLRYSFTKGTAQEVSFLVEHLGLRPGHRVLDVGCGPGRHALAMAAQGIAVTGVDISQTFIDLATEAASAAGVADLARFVRADARAHGALPGAGYDAAIALCQGAFGLQGGPAGGGDLDVLGGMARAVRPGGAVVVSAFSAYFQVAHLDDPSSFDASTGTQHEHTTVKDHDGRDAPAELWTTCYTPRELRLAARLCGLEPEAVHSVDPGRYGTDTPSVGSTEFLLVARRPA